MQMLGWIRVVLLSFYTEEQIEIMSKYNEILVF